MESKIDWLPPLVLLTEYGNDWKKYLDAIYGFYKKDFLDTRPRYKCVPVGIKRYPIKDGKESGFWHLIQEGRIEDDRVPNFRRCERICWPRPIIEHSHESSILVWPNVRYTAMGRQENLCLWLEEYEYLVILRKRKNGYLFWTAYPVTEDHQKRKNRKEYERSKKTGDVISGDPETPSTRGR